MRRSLFGPVLPLSGTPLPAGRFYAPEALTPLAWTAPYRDLSPAARLSYNQLHALYINEQIAWFELTLAGFVDAVAPLLPRQADLRNFAEQERRHAAGFHAFNARREPGLSLVAAPSLVRWTARWPRLLPFWIPVILLLEERAVHFAESVLAESSELDPDFVACHARHLEEEADHLELDAYLLHQFWCRQPLAVRRCNAWLFEMAVRQALLFPRRSALRVIGVWRQRHPEAAGVDWRRELKALEENREFRRSVYSPEVCPRTFALLGALPEFNSVLEWLCR